MCVKSISKGKILDRSAAHEDYRNLYYLYLGDYVFSPGFESITGPRWLSSICCDFYSIDRSATFIISYYDCSWLAIVLALLSYLVYKLWITVSIPTLSVIHQLYLCSQSQLTVHIKADHQLLLIAIVDSILLFIYHMSV
jgi:hypothetical protein